MIDTSAALLRRLLESWPTSDPAEALKRSVRAMEDQVPELNEALAMIKAEHTLAHKDVQALDAKRAELREKIDAALSEGRDDRAACYQECFDAVARERHQAATRLSEAEEIYAKAQAVKRRFMAAKEERIEATRRALSAQRQSEWGQSLIAKLAPFEATIRDRSHEAWICELRTDAAKTQLELDALLKSSAACGDAKTSPD